MCRGPRLDPGRFPIIISISVPMIPGLLTLWVFSCAPMEMLSAHGRALKIIDGKILK